MLMRKKFTRQTWLQRMWLFMGCLAAMTAAQAASITVDGINYTTSGAKATVAKYTIDKSVSPADSLFYKGDIVIPEKFTYEGTEYTVVATAAKCFENCREITSITLPETCTNIARFSFTGCTALKISPIPATATTIGSGVFKGCTNLEEVTIVPGWNKPISEEFSGCPNLKRLIIADGPDPVEMKINMFGNSSDARGAINSIEYIYMGRNVDASKYQNNEQPFHNMGALKTLVIGGQTTTIQGTTFQGCTALTTVTFTEGNIMSSIGISAFASCTSLTGIDLPAGITVIEQGVFNGCHNLRSVTMSDAVTSISSIAFYNTGLTTITFPSSLTSIGQSAFENSKLSGNIVLPGNLTSVGAQAFSSTLISSISIPASVTSIGNGALAPIPTLTSINLDEGNTSFKIDNGVLLNASGSRLIANAHDPSFGTTYSNATVTSIDNFGMAYAPFTSVDLPALANVGNYGFAYSNIEAFTLENNVTVGMNLFSGSALKSIVIAEGRHEIPQGLCAQCPQLTSVVLPSTTTNMMRNCFEGCTALEEMEIPTNANYLEPGSIPATIKRLRVLNVSVPVLADGVFNPSQSNVECKVAVTSVDKYKEAPQWQYLNIEGDPTISGNAAQLGCPTGLYFATKSGKLMYRDENGNVIDTEFATGDHAFNLASYKNRIYVGVAGKNFRYQDAAAQANGGDGEVFYVNNTDGIFYRVTVLNNVGYKAFEDPFSLSILEDENKIVIADRNVGVHEMDADAVGLYGSQPFLVQNNQLKYYANQTAGMMYGGIGCGFYKVNGVYWMGKKFNGFGIFRFRKSDIAVDNAGNPTAATMGEDPFKIILPYVQMTQFYVDQANGQIYFYMQENKNPNGPKTPGVYRLPMSAVEAHDAAGEDTPITEAILIDDSPVLKEGETDECVGITQFTSDGEHVYWSYIASPSDDKSMPNSVPVDLTNPLHHSGIKCIAAKPNEDGTMPTAITFAVEGVEAYGVCGATYIAPVEPEPVLKGDVNGDGEITVADVNAIITIILGNTGNMDGDVNGDGEITVADINTVIGIILGA